MRCLRRSARCRVGTGGPDQMLRTTINWSAYRKATEEAKVRSYGLYSSVLTEYMESPLLN